MDASAPILLFDSGVGGLTVLAELPNLRVANGMDADKVRERLRDATDQLAKVTGMQNSKKKPGAAHPQSDGTPADALGESGGARGDTG